jgi:hypothetical protein
LLGESQPAKGGDQSTIMRGSGASYCVPATRCVARLRRKRRSAYNFPRKRQLPITPVNASVQGRLRGRHEPPKPRRPRALMRISRSSEWRRCRRQCLGPPERRLRAGSESLPDLAARN